MSQEAIDESIGQVLVGPIYEHGSQVTPDTIEVHGSQASPDTTEKPIDESTIISPDLPCH